MDWHKILGTWKYLRLFFLAFFMGACLGIYGLTKGSTFWIVSGLVVILVTAVLLRREWKKGLKWHLRFLFRDD